MRSIIVFAVLCLMVSPDAANAQFGIDVNRIKQKLEEAKKQQEEQRKRERAKIISSDRIGLAAGSLSVQVTEGSDGVFLFSHLHGRHKGRSGKTNYTYSAMVRDEGNYYYFAAPPESLGVSGDIRRPDTNKHKHKKYKLSGEAIEAHKQGVKLLAVAVAARNRRNLGSQVGDLLSGATNPENLLRQLNKGKKPAYK